MRFAVPYDLFFVVRWYLSAVVVNNLPGNYGFFELLVQLMLQRIWQLSLVSLLEASCAAVV